MRRLAVIAVLAALSAGVAVQGVRAQTVLPPSLAGESFFADQLDNITNGRVDINAACATGTPESDTWTYTASGAAAGPYAGTFTESGTVSVSLTPQPPLGNVGESVGVVTRWQAQFTIDSPLGQVSGTKTLLLGNTAECASVTAGGMLHAADASAALSYQATITTASGTFNDSGTATSVLSSQTCTSGPLQVCGVTFFQAFEESFDTSNGVLPLDTSGEATGGGQVVVTGSNPFDRATFGFNVRKTEDGKLDGRCNIVDQATGTHVECLDATDYQQIGNTATWSGQADVNGVVEEYRITAQDNGEPNQGLDTFAFHSASYDVGGNVQDGDVQIHKQTTP